MLRPPTVTARVSGRSRAPPHARHGISRMNCSSLLALALGVGLDVPPLDVGHHALVRGPVRALPAVSVLVARRRSPRRSRTGRRRARFFGQLLPRRVERRSRGPRPPPRAPGTSTRACRWPTARARPRAIDRSGSGTTSSASTSSRVPRPSHVGHAPYGELNEKFRGASSSNDSPQNVHASAWLEGLELLAASCGLHGDRGDALRPARARSRPSRRRAAGCPAWRRAGRRRPRSCACSSWAAGSARRAREPRRRSARGRTPCARGRRAASRTRPCAPGRPAPAPGTGCPRAARITWSTICSGVWRPIGRPQLGQCGCPTRAKSTRR